MIPSLDSPKPWIVQGRGLVPEQSPDWPRTRTRTGSVHVLGAVVVLPRDGHVDGGECPPFSPTAMSARVLRFTGVGPHGRLTMNPAVSSLDPNTVRAAVAGFTPRRPQRFQELSPEREAILELRQKRVSSPAIHERLPQRCLPTSKIWHRSSQGDSGLGVQSTMTQARKSGRRLWGGRGTFKDLRVGSTHTRRFRSSLECSVSARRTGL